MNKKRMILKYFTAIFCGLFLAAANAEILPINSFANHALISSPTLSPDGKHLAAVISRNHARDLIVVDVKSKEVTQITQIPHEFLSHVIWATNERLLMAFEYFGTQTAFFALDIDGSNIVNLFRADDEDPPQFAHELLNILHQDPDHILIQYHIGGAENPSVYRVDIRNGERQLVQQNEYDIRYWMSDSSGQLRLALAREGRIKRWYYRHPNEQEWHLLHSYDVTSEPLFSVQGITLDGSRLYVSSRHESDLAALYAYDPRNRKFLEKILDHPQVDVSGPILREIGNNKPFAVMVNAEKPEIHYLDEKWAAHQRWLDAELPNRVNHIVQSNGEAGVMLVWSGTSTDPGHFYLYRSNNKELEELFSVAPWIAERKMASMKPITYSARDGQKIPGYLTVPKDSNGKQLPVVVVVHGGPGARDGWGFDPWVQFLANRGYAVFQPNFRGSTGYGWRFEQAGYGEWGRLMQNDVADGVRWLIQQGIADADRICIYGASYGGYATLSGLTATPGLYRCGIAEAGVYDLEKFLDGDKDSWFFELQRVMVGDPVNDQLRLRNTSPIHHVQNIQAPIMVVHGARDYRLRIDHAEGLLTELTRHNKAYEYLPFEQAGHSRVRSADRKRLFHHVERFLAKHLQPEDY